MIYVTLNPDNETDRQILEYIKEEQEQKRFKWKEETVQRHILQKRILKNKHNRFTRNKKNRIEELIEIGIEKRCEKTGMSREDVIRETFCLYFNIPFPVKS